MSSVSSGRVPPPPYRGSSVDQRVSHTRFWRDSADVAQDDPVLSELTPAPRAAQQHRNARGEIRSLVDGDYHFIQGVGGVDELFDLRADPSEANDLKGREHLPSRALMWQQLRAYNVGFPRKLAGISTER